jgi:hypothetical protein
MVGAGMSDGIGYTPYSPPPDRDPNTRMDLAALQDAVRQQERRLDRQAAVISALADVIRELAGAEADEFLARVRALVAGRRADPPRACAGCGRALGAKQARCIYCGTAAPVESVADLL